MPTASIDVMQPARGHGQCRQEDGEIPNRRDDFIVHNKIKYRCNDTDNDKEANQNSERLALPEKFT